MPVINGDARNLCIAVGMIWRPWKSRVAPLQCYLFIFNFLIVHSQGTWYCVTQGHFHIHTYFELRFFSKFSKLCFFRLPISPLHLFTSFSASMSYMQIQLCTYIISQIFKYRVSPSYRNPTSTYHPWTWEGKAGKDAFWQHCSEKLKGVKYPKVHQFMKR